MIIIITLVNQKKITLPHEEEEAVRCISMCIMYTKDSVYKSNTKSSIIMYFLFQSKWNLSIESHCSADISTQVCLEKALHSLHVGQVVLVASTKPTGNINEHSIK